MLSRRGDVLVSETQRSRMLTSAVALISERGYGEMSVARVAAGAGVSRRTFYDLFEDREDCFLAVFDEAVAGARELVLEGYRGAEGWEAQVRAGLFALLLFLDREPGIRRLLVVDALRTGPRVQERRAEIIEALSAALHETGTRARRGRRELPELLGEGVTGAVLGVIHTRLLSKRPGPMVSLLNQLMGLIVLPYLGSEAATRELSRPAPSTPRARPEQAASHNRPDPLTVLPMRVTYRTLMVLAAIAEEPGVSNRGVADAADVSDQGQISKLLSRLQKLGLIENSAPGQPSGEPNQWRLTPHGTEVQQALKAASTTNSPKGLA